MTATADRGRLFDAVAEDYNAVRPAYPEGVYVAIDSMTGPLAGLKVVDLAAGPGTATRQLVDRGADVVAIDPGEPLVRLLRGHVPAARPMVARAEQLPLRDHSVDLVCCATAWHWVNVDQALAEVRRVVRPGGHVALWWANHLYDRRVDWERAQDEVYSRWKVRTGSRPPGVVGVGPRDAARHLRSKGLQVVVDTEFRWSRVVRVDDHVRLLGTHSDVLVLGEQRERYLQEVATALSPWQQVTERLWGPLVVARIS